MRRFYEGVFGKDAITTLLRGDCQLTPPFQFILGGASLICCTVLEDRQQMGNTPPETVLGIVASGIGLMTLLPGSASISRFGDIPQSIIIGLDFVAFSLHLAAGVVSAR